ncbi:unnamed protein product [Trifolium pratense]|uniref:Uncharacterized protein n=1 Tax=Trifolium pratense TaxID=57577 RepID=A0ACB0IT75_TRIPR|nr:unnamed protein product [Trifolium pratense]
MNSTCEYDCLGDTVGTWKCGMSCIALAVNPRICLAGLELLLSLIIITAYGFISEIFIFEFVAVVTF